MRSMTVEDEVLQRANAADIDLTRVVFVNNSGVPRGRVVGADGLEGALNDGINITQAMQSFTALDRVAGEGQYGPAGEVRVMPDPKTFTDVPYDDRAGLLLADLYNLDGEPWAAGPRAQLREFLADLEYTPEASFESEYYLVRETENGVEPFDDSTCFSTDGMRSAHDIILDTVDALEQQGMSLSVYYPEYGPGQQELVIEHDSGVTAPDNYIRFKETVAGVARDHGLGATFRPKPFPKLPGSGCHTHISLWREDENVLHDSDAGGRYPLSRRGRHFVGGILEHAPALLALTAPTVESYDRLAPGMWSSAYVCWGHDNREAAVRVPSVDADRPEATTRVEFKPVDNTINPYLVQFGLLAAGVDGLERELDPGEPLNCNPESLDDDEREARGYERFPTTLAEAVDALDGNDVLRNAMGDTLVDSYVQVKRSEWEESTDESGEWESDYLARGF
jgi:glutamine synthetase